MFKPNESFTVGRPMNTIDQIDLIILTLVQRLQRLLKPGWKHLIWKSYPASCIHSMLLLSMITYFLQCHMTSLSSTSQHMKSPKIWSIYIFRKDESVPLNLSIWPESREKIVASHGQYFELYIGHCSFTINSQFLMKSCGNLFVNLYIYTNILIKVINVWKTVSCCCSRCIFLF